MDSDGASDGTMVGSIDSEVLLVGLVLGLAESDGIEDGFEVGAIESDGLLLG